MKRESSIEVRGGARTLLGQPLEAADYGVAFEHLHLVDNSRIPVYIVTILQCNNASGWLTLEPQCILQSSRMRARSGGRSSAAS